MKAFLFGILGITFLGFLTCVAILIFSIILAYTPEYQEKIKDTDIKKTVKEKLKRKSKEKKEVKEDIVVTKEKKYMVCKQCKKHIDLDSAFCKYCGNKIN